MPEIPQRSLRTQKQADAPGSVPVHGDTGHSVAYQLRSEKGQPSGYPGLDELGFVDPPIKRIRSGLAADRPASGDFVGDAWWAYNTAALSLWDGSAWQSLAAGGGDPDAIHDNVAGEIAAIAEKAVPVAADLAVIEDSAAGNVKKRVQLGNLPGGAALTVQEEDGTPIDTAVTIIRVPNGSLTDNGAGDVSLGYAPTDHSTPAASATVQGHVELATIAETDTGTDAGRAVTPDGLAGSNYGERAFGILVSDPNGDAITVGDGKAVFRVPSLMNGFNLVEVAASLSTVSSSGIPTVQIRRSRRASATTRTNADMLSTKLTIDASEFDSEDAAAAAVIDTANDDVITGDHIYIDIDVAGTGAKGLFVLPTFRLP